ncbi:MAG: alpha-glucosidase [Steroidobacteraceae bacterium]
MNIIELADGFDLVLGGRTLLRHRAFEPCVFVGTGTGRYQMRQGHFTVQDDLFARLPLTHATVRRGSAGISVQLAQSPGSPVLLELLLTGGDAHVTCCLQSKEPSLNRMWFRMTAEDTEQVWGAGEQMSYFNLRGRHFPLWTSEPGVGRDKSTEITFQADRTAGAGGDYYTTYYPQPTYLSSRRYALHVQTTAYSAFDFRQSAFHEIEVWAIPERIELWAGAHFTDLVAAISTHFGRQPPLPQWILAGAIIGLKDGTRSFERLEKIEAQGAAVAGLWCEDWVGVRQTGFGTRLFWDWKWNAERYPRLPERIAELRKRGIRFLGYVNPYLCTDGSLYPQASAAGFLVRRIDRDEPYLVDFGEFVCGMVDFTQAEACTWFAEHIIGRNLIDFGLSGWMADFGEYLPVDVRLASGVAGEIAHNAWPTYWAEVNAQALERRGKAGEIVFFMRAGFTGVQRFCPLLWAGDQSVDFTRHDGLQTVICAALSSGLLGNAYHHSDIGGYTSLFGNVRTAELLQRWTEMAAFTAVMRTHEGNRPRENLQIDDDPNVLTHFARMTRMHRHLAPYLRALGEEATTSGLPLQRPLFLHFEDDPKCYETQTEYLLGHDLLVAPVITAGARTRRTYLPAGARWRHLWTAAEFLGGTDVDIAAPLGEPPVFYRVDSIYRELFESLPGC